MKFSFIVTTLFLLLFSKTNAKDWQKIDASPAPVSFELPKGYTFEKKEKSNNYSYKSKISKGKDSVHFWVRIKHKPKKAATQARLNADFFLNIFSEYFVSGKAFLHKGRVVYEIRYKEGNSHTISRFIAFGEDFYVNYIVYSKDKFADKEADYLLNSTKSNAALPDYEMPMEEYLADAHYAFSDNKNWMLDYTMPWVKDSSGLSFRIFKNYFIDTTINDTTNKVTYKLRNENNRLCFVSIDNKGVSKTLEECKAHIQNEFNQLKEEDISSIELNIKTTTFNVNGYPAVKCTIDSEDDEAVYVVIIIAFKQYEVFVYLEKTYVDEQYSQGINRSIKLEEKDRLFLNSFKIE